MNKKELYSHPGWELCTFEGSRRHVLQLGLESTFMEKLRWLEEAETLAIGLRANRSAAGNRGEGNQGEGAPGEERRS